VSIGEHERLWRRAATQGSSAKQVPFHAFISYSHGADARLAAALQRSLERLARPWYQLRSKLRVFRDETDLAIGPNLQRIINEGLGQSEWLLLFACPEAAQSHWVGKEIEWWLENRSIDRFLLVRTRGSMEWDSAKGDFDWSNCSALPELLRGRFRGEPHYVDLSSLSGRSEISIHDVTLRSAGIKIAARLLGRSPAEIESEDLSQVRRNKGWAVAAVLLTTVAAAAAVLEWWSAERRAEDLRVAGIDARSKELAGNAEAAHAAGADELAVLLAYYSLLVEPDSEHARLRAVAAMARSPARAVLRGHKEAVVSVAFSNDGRQLITASKDGTARLWDATLGAQMRVIEEKHPLTGATFSRDGRSIVTTSYSADTAARTYEAATGRLLQDLYGAFVMSADFSPSGKEVVSGGKDMTVYVSSPNGKPRLSLTSKNPIDEVKYSPDGRYILARSDDATLLLWRSDGTPIPGFHGYKGTVIVAQFTPDSRNVLSVAADGAALWEASTGKLVRSFKLAESSLMAGAISPDGARLAIVGDDRKIQLLDVASGKSVGLLRSPGETLTQSVTFSHDGRLLGGIGNDGSALIWEVGTGQLLGQFRGHTGDIDELAFNIGDTMFATADEDATVRLWQVLSILPEYVLNVKGESLKSARFSLSGDRVLAQTASGAVQIWPRDRLAEAPALTLSRPFKGTFGSLSLSPDGNRLVWIDMSHVAHVVEASDGREVALVQGMPEGSEGVTFSPDSGRFAARDEGKIRIWSASTGAPISTVKTGSLSVGDLAFNPTGRRLVSCDLEGRARLWDAERGNLVAELTEAPESGTVERIEGPECSAFFSPDGAEIMTIANDGITRWWEAASGRFLKKARGHRGAVSLATYGKGGSIALTVGVDRTIRIWDIRSGRAVALIGEQTADILSAEFNGDGRLLLSTGKDGLVRIWDSSEGVELMSLRAADAKIQQAHFDPQGGRVIATGADGAARIWNVAMALLPAADFLLILRQRIDLLGLRLSPEECQLYFTSPLGPRPPECGH